MDNARIQSLSGPQLFNLIREGRAYSALESLPKLLEKCPEHTPRVVEFVRRALVGREDEEVGAAVTALLHWQGLDEQGAAALLRSLLDQLLMTVSTGRETGLTPMLFGVRALVQKGLLRGEDDVNLLEGVLGDLWETARY